MSGLEMRNDAKRDSINRPLRQIDLPKDSAGKPIKASQYFGELVFDFKTAEGIPENVRKEMIEVAMSGKSINRATAEVVAEAVTNWAIKKGATHFCHWFQPLTGATAEKHDAFLQIKNGKPIEKLSVSQLLQGEPDASSFPNGGSRSTFEARGYTTWDLTSPMFISEGSNGRTLCIPTAFVSYHGDALDVKTPLLRSISKLDKVATRFFHLIGKDDVKEVIVTAGCEQEYFLIDKSFYYNRPDLVMSGRTVFGTLSVKNQQLEDHYFGLIPERVLGFMQELDYELHRLGIPSKTRHNEVAPGQFEVAPIFNDANVAADQNQLLMATLKRVAFHHDMVVLLHEKPFAGINGSGKHVNWSMSSDTGINLLDPGSAPHHNRRFLAVIAIVFEAVNRYQGALRMAIASAANDHRLGANEAPPSIISVFLGDTLDKIFKSIHAGHDYTPEDEKALDLGAHQLADLLRDNTDRNRTSPFAFTGNKFEFRAVGSSAAVGFPISILNAAVTKVMEESCEIIEEELKNGQGVDDALRTITKKWTDASYEAIVFNGDGYSEEWVKEASKRGLKNLRTTPEALKILDIASEMDFLVEQNIFRPGELKTRYNVLIERYNKIREIEFKTLISMIQQSVIPSAIEYKAHLGNVVKTQKEIGIDAGVELAILTKLKTAVESLYKGTQELEVALEGLEYNEQKRAEKLASDIFPMTVKLAKHCNEIEAIVPNALWVVPKYYDMLFLR